MSQTNKPIAKKTENKPLTQAQHAHLAALTAEKQRIEAEIERFVAYLATEHKTPAVEGWTSIDPKLGFVREITTDESSDTKASPLNAIRKAEAS